MLLVTEVLVEMPEFVACKVLELGDLHLLHSAWLLWYVVHIYLLPWIELKLHSKWVLLLRLHSV